MARQFILFSAFLLAPFFLLGQSDQAPSSTDSTYLQFRRPSLEIEGETVICPGSITALKVKGEYASYRWSTGHQTPNVTIFKPGTYHVTVTTRGGCEFSGSVTVRYSDSPCL